MNNKILFVIPSLNYGGAEILLLQQINWLADKGYSVYLAILSSNNNEELLKEVQVPPSQIIIINSPSAILNTKAIFFAFKKRNKLTSFVKKFELKTIIAHLPLAHFWARIVKVKLPTVYLLVYHHSMQYQANPLNSIAKKVFNNIQKKLANRADDISICISNAVKENIKQNFVLKNPVVLYNAVQDRLEEDVELSKKRELNPLAVKIIFPGRLHPAKGHLFFLKVFKLLLEKVKLPIELIIAGGGGLIEEIRQYIEENKLTENVRITGFLSNELMLEEMSRADFIIIPSISEGLGIVGIEALMLGKTVVSSDAGGLKEIFTHKKNGYLFKAGDIQSCLNTLEDVLSSLPTSILPAPLLREDYMQRFSFDVYMKRLEHLIKKEADE